MPARFHPLVLRAIRPRSALVGCYIPPWREPRTRPQDSTPIGGEREETRGIERVGGERGRRDLVGARTERVPTDARVLRGLATGAGKGVQGGARGWGWKLRTRLATPRATNERDERANSFLLLRFGRSSDVPS